MGLRYNRRLVPNEGEWTTGETMLVFTADVFPVAYLSIPPNTIPAPSEDRPPPDELRGRASESSLYTQGLQSYGIGGSPVGFRLNYRASNRVAPFVSGSTGFVYFSESIPDERGKHLNFTFDVGLGLQVALWQEMALSFGYRYHHLSNGFRGQINPGVDANLFYLGISVWQ